VATILVVCTGNICRSPIAEGFLRQQLALRGIDDVAVESAGISGWDGAPATPEAVDALMERQLDIRAHEARRLNRRMVEDADLVLAMAAEHREAVGRIAPAAAGRTFTLKELVHLLDGDRPATESLPAGDRLAEVAKLAASLRDAGKGNDLHDQDVADPLGLGIHAFRAAAWELGELSEQLVDQVFGPPDGVSPVEGADRAASSAEPWGARERR
jgi:protein-tyrosine phosphatase